MRAVPGVGPPGRYEPDQALSRASSLAHRRRREIRLSTAGRSDKGDEMGKPTTRNACGRPAVMAIIGRSWAATRRRPRGGRGWLASIWRSARIVTTVPRLAKPSRSRPASKLASGLVCTGLRPRYVHGAEFETMHRNREVGYRPSGAVIVIAGRRRSVTWKY